MLLYSIFLQIGSNVFSLDAVPSHGDKISVRKFHSARHCVKFKVFGASRHFGICVPVQNFRILTDCKHQFFNQGFAAGIITYAKIRIAFGSIFDRKNQKIVPQVPETVGCSFYREEKDILQSHRKRRRMQAYRKSKNC